MEIWKDVVGFPGYQVSSEGRVRSHGKVTRSARFPERHWKDRIIKQKWQNNRARVELWRENGEHKTCQVHRLVGFAFLGAPENDEMTINHIDGNPRNNCISNLEWLTRGDNVRDAFARGVVPTTKGIPLTDGTNVYEFKSLAECSRFLGRNHGYVSRRLKKGLETMSSESRVFWVTPCLL